MSVGQATSRVGKPEPATLSSKDQLVRPLAAPASSGQGRTLEFIGQELLREFTTIGSKIVSHEGASIVIDAKGTLERIREQVSNVE